MALPPPPPSGGHGPFGDKAFKSALVGCAALIVAGLVMLGGGDATADVGTAFVVLGALGLVMGGLGLLVERRIERRHAKPPDSPNTD
jgi:drug/metabolite transporter (DMT)-like permease